MKMSLMSAGGTCMAMAFFTEPLPRSKKKRRGWEVPLPSSTIMDVPFWRRFGGHGELPRNVIRISLSGRISVPGRYMLRFLIAGQGL